MRTRLAAITAASALVAAAGVTAYAASGAPTAVTAPRPGQHLTVTWTGTIPPGANPTSDCTTDLPTAVDSHAIKISVPKGLYDKGVTTASFSITWKPSSGVGTSDEILTVVDPDGTATSADTSSTTEQVSRRNPAGGTYSVQACGYTNGGPQDYVGKLELSTVRKGSLPTYPTGGITPTTETVADPFRLGTEPTNVVASDGTVYESQIFGFSTTQSFLQRSDDGGATFRTLSLGAGTPLEGVGKLDQCTGGGDSALATDHIPGDVWMIDLGGAPEVPARVSHDHGKTWASNCEANFHDGANYFTDRQWLSTDYAHNKMLYIYRDGLASVNGVQAGSVDVSRQMYGEYIKTAPLPSKPGQAGAGNITFGSLCQQSGVAAPCVTDVSIAGPPVTDNVSRHKGTTYLPIETDTGLRVVRIVPRDKKPSISESTIVKGAHQVLFPVAAVDRAGTVYLAWSDAKTYQTQYVYSTDQGAHWSAPIHVNGAPAAVTVMPTIVAGDPGRVDIAFYGASNEDDPTHNSGPWHVYLAQTLDADSAHPHFAQARMSDRPNHIDPVCLSGLGCTLDTGPGGDRELGDFFTISLDKSGRAMISFADGDNQLGQEVANGPAAAPSFAHFVRQATGPSLYKSVGKVPALPTRSGGVSVTPKGAGAQLVSSAASYDAKGDLVVTLRGRNLDQAGGPVTTYLTRFVHGNAVYAVGAENDGGSWRYFAGPAAPVSDGLAIKYAYYPATTDVTGTVDAKSGTITLTVPPAAIGSPKADEQLYAVTSYVLTHLVPTAPLPPEMSNYTDFPVVADSLPSYNVPARR